MSLQLPLLKQDFFPANTVICCPDPQKPRSRGFARGAGRSCPYGATNRVNIRGRSTTTLGSTESDTILGGVVFLYTSGSWPLALIVLIASVMVPLGKLLALAYLLFAVQRRSLGSNRERTRLYRIVEFVGRWSMLDVFVDTFTVALVQLSPLMSVEPGPGVLFCAAVVVLTMLAAESFDPRLIWDSNANEIYTDG